MDIDYLNEMLYITVEIIFLRYQTFWNLIVHLKHRRILPSMVPFPPGIRRHPMNKRFLEAFGLQHILRLFFGLLILVVGCTTDVNVKTGDPRQHLLDNLSSDIAEINLIAENASKEFEAEPFEIRILDAWSLAKEKQFQKIGGGQAQIITVLQTSVIEIPTLKETIVIEISKIQEGEDKLFGVARPQSGGAFYTQAPLLAEVGGYSIRLYDPSLDLDQEAIEAIKRYVMLTARFEQTAKIIFKKMLEVQEKYRDAAVSIESFDIHLPSIAIDIHFRIKSPS